ncbi:MAG TPA: hypothetical protein V6D05_07345 [Stenomitos sp.]
MASEQSRYLVAPAAEASRVVAALRAAFPTALIGTRPHEGDTVLLAVTLYSEHPEGLDALLSALGADSLDVPPIAPPKSLSDLVDEIKRLQQNPS